MSNEHPEAFVGTYHRASVEEWSHDDSVEEEMRTIEYGYVEAFRLLADGAAVGMLEIGPCPVDPAVNGAAEIDPGTASRFDRIGTWYVKGEELVVSLGKRSDQRTLQENWVGIFYLPGRSVR